MRLTTPNVLGTHRTRETDSLHVGLDHGDYMSLRPRRRGFALAMLTLIYALSYVDRQIVNILAEGIKRELNLSDAEVGMITGLSFALLYATLCVPAARFADRHNRVRIISGALLIWSAFTVACGLAQNIVQLILARIGVGVGEAGSTPPSHSLIADYYPADRRASAIAIYSLGIPIGGMLGAIIGGIAMHVIGWRGAFIIAGAPGIIVAVVTWWTVPEPRLKSLVAASQSEPFIKAIGSILAVRSYRSLVAAMALFSIHGYASAAFGASFALRNYSSSLEQLSKSFTSLTTLDIGASGMLGLLSVVPGIASLFGTLAGGRLADRYGRTRPFAYAEIPAIGLVLACLAYWILLFAPTKQWVLPMAMVSSFTGSLIFGPVYSSIQSIMPVNRRATASAVTLLIVNLVALGTGPLMVGAVSDALRVSMGDADGLTFALMAGSTTLLFAAATLWRARRGLALDLMAARDPFQVDNNRRHS